MPYSILFTDLDGNTSDEETISGSGEDHSDSDTGTDTEVTDGNEKPGQAANPTPAAADNETAPAEQPTEPAEPADPVEDEPLVEESPEPVDPSEKRLAKILDINYRCPECLKYYGNLCIPIVLKCGHHMCHACLAKIEKETEPPNCKECGKEAVTNKVVSLKTENNTLKKICEEYSQLQADHKTAKNENISCIFEKIYKKEVESILTAKDVLTTYKLEHATKIEVLQKYFTELTKEIGKVKSSFNKFYAGVSGALQVESVTNYIRKLDQSRKEYIELILEAFELCRKIKPMITYDKISEFTFSKSKKESISSREIVAVMEKGDSRIYYRVTTFPERSQVHVHCAEECNPLPTAMVIDYEIFKDRKKFDNCGYFLKVASIEETQEIRFNFLVDCLFNTQTAKLCVGESGQSYKGSHVRLFGDSLVVPEYGPIDKKRADEANSKRTNDIIYGIPDMIKGTKSQVGSVYTMRQAGVGAQLFISTTSATRSYCVAAAVNPKQVNKISDKAKILDCGKIFNFKL